jgi:hypothetical protein
MNGKQSTEQPKIRPNNSRPARPGGRNLTPRPKETCKWGDIDNQVLRDALVAVADSGAAIQFSKTSDGGALVIHIYDGANKVDEYPRTVDETEKTLRWLVDMFTDD